MSTRIGGNSTRYEILDALCEDGFELENAADALPVSKAIQRGARAGTLLWTRKHIITTGHPRVTTRGRVVSVSS